MIKGWKFEPVRWATSVLALLIAVETANEALHLLPEAYTPWLLGAIAVLTAVLGKLARDKVTPLAAPKTAWNEKLVPTSFRADSTKPRP